MMDYGVHGKRNGAGRLVKSTISYTSIGCDDSSIALLSTYLYSNNNGYGDMFHKQENNYEPLQGPPGTLVSELVNKVCSSRLFGRF